MMTGCQIGLLIVSLSTGFLANSPASKLRWNDDYGNAMHAAQSSERPMVVVLENPENTGQRLDTEKLNEVNRERLKSEEYELCRVNVNTTYGKLVAKAFGANQFPYTAVTDDKSKRIIFRKAGQMSQLDWTHALAKGTAQPLADDTQLQIHHSVTEFGVSPVTATPAFRTCFT